MIIIYNLSGLLVGLLGAAAFILGIFATNSVGVGLLLGGLTWVGAGFWWRSKSKPGMPKNAYPAVFFIPLPAYGVVAVLLAILVMLVDWKRASEPVDPRAEQFRADEYLMTSSTGGNVELSTAVHKAITSNDASSAVKVVTHVEKDRVLVLAQISKLKEYNQDARQALLDRVLKSINESPNGKGKSAFVGIKGRVIYGIIHVPPNVTHIDETVDKEMLYDFYGPPQPAAQPTATATATK